MYAEFSTYHEKLKHALHKAQLTLCYWNHFFTHKSVIIKKPINLFLPRAFYLSDIEKNIKCSKQKQVTIDTLGKCYS